MKKYLVCIALVLALMGTPVLAAQDNTALINSLMQQVEQLMTILRTLLAQQTGQSGSSASLSDTIVVTSPKTNQTVDLPYKIIGKAKNVFEGWGNAQLFDSNGQKLDEVFVMPGGDNGCDYGAGFCPFSVSIGKPWSVSPTSKTGYVLFTESEAKGDTPKSFKLPVKFQKTQDNFCLKEGEMRGAGQQCCTGLILKPTTQSGTVGTCSKIGLSTSAGLTVSKILNSNGFVNGKKQNSQYSYDYISDVKIVDIDSDGLNEAFATYTTCGASCGRSVYIFRLNQNVVEAVSLPESMVAGAAQNIDSVVVSNGIISVTETDFGGTITNRYKVSVSNGRMVVLMQICPDSKTIDKMPTTDPNPNRIYSYFILNNLRRELTEFDSNWGAANCTVKENIVY